MSKHLTIFFALTIVAVLAGCASTNEHRTEEQAVVPANILLVPAVDLTVNEVAADVAQHLGKEVRWGGKIVAAVPRQSATRLTIQAFPLNSEGEPDRRAPDELIGDEFMVDVATFDYLGEDRYITVFGPITSQVVSGEGHEAQVLPVVAALQAKEWGERKSSYPKSKLQPRSNNRDLSNGTWSRRGTYNQELDPLGNPRFRTLSPYGTSPR